MTLREWLDWRARLNHDLLINRIRNVVGAVAREATDCDDALALMRTWISRQDEYQEFILAAADVLSAARLFDAGSPACEICKGNLADWKELAHRFFLAETGIQAKLDKLNVDLRESVELAERLVAAESADDRKAIASLLFAATGKLSSGISALPSRAVTEIAAFC